MRGATIAALAAVLALAGLPAVGQPSPAKDEWVAVDYGALVDRRAITHSGEPVGALLERLGRRPLPTAEERPEDRTAHALLEPMLEPYAHVLADAADALAPAGPRPFVEVGALWHHGTAQPAWVELLRSRRLLVESDGAGRMRAFLPAPDGAAAVGGASEAVARAAWNEAWSVLRHVLAAERRRLGAGATAPPKLAVEVWAYVHLQERTVFLLGARAYRAEVADTAPRRTEPGDLGELARFLASGLKLEGARLEPDGTLVLLGSRPSREPSLLGRPLGLADLAVAWRAVRHGGLAAPYMSLDRGFSPQTATVNYGGRLRDTALGLVSLLCDVRFKTFSLGFDVESGADVRATVREASPDFRTHLERFAADPASEGVLAQQTRLWFYPDDVDLTVSPETDVLVLRRVRMSAASERIQESTQRAEGAAEVPPWTRATVDAIDRDYDALATRFPELADLDQVVRLLSLMTWLDAADRAGLALPDLDALLDVELPALYTPRSFPQLLVFNALPPPGSAGALDAFERLDVVDALDRLAPVGAEALPARARLARAAAALDPADAQHASMLEELRAKPLAQIGEADADLLAYRAERLRMHALVLATLGRERAEPLVERQRGGERLRIFSVGIGGLDLGMGPAMARASGRRLGLGGALPVSRTTRERATRATRAASAGGASSTVGGTSVLPAHGDRDVTTISGEAGRRTVVTLLGADGPDVVRRRVELGADGRATRFARYERGRRLDYRLGGGGDVLTATLETAAILPPEPEAAPLPPGLARLQLAPAPPDSTTIGLRLEIADAAGPRRLDADLPRRALERVVLGRGVDRTPGEPMALGALPPPLDAADALMVLQDPRQRAAPWDAPSQVVPGEADAARIARALNAWAGASSRPGPTAVVGTDPLRSGGRWDAAPRAKTEAPVVWVPEGALPAGWERIATSLGPRIDRLPPEGAPTVVILISAEPPGPLAERLRALARSPELEGRLLAVWPLAGPLRSDLPASLLGEGRLAGLGVAPPGLPPRRTLGTDVAAYAAALASPLAAGQRIERVAGPFVWYF